MIFPRGYFRFNYLPSLELHFIAKNYNNPIDKFLFSLNQKLEIDGGILANQLARLGK